MRTALGSEGGVADGITTVEAHVQSILMQEEAHAAHARGAMLPRPRRQCHATKNEVHRHAGRSRCPAERNVQQEAHTQGLKRGLGASHMDKLNSQIESDVRALIAVRAEEREGPDGGGVLEEVEEGEEGVRLMEQALDILEQARVMLSEAESKVEIPSKHPSVYKVYLSLWYHSYVQPARTSDRESGAGAAWLPFVPMKLISSFVL